MTVCHVYNKDQNYAAFDQLAPEESQPIGFLKKVMPDYAWDFGPPLSLSLTHFCVPLRGSQALFWFFSYLFFISHLSSSFLGQDRFANGILLFFDKPFHFIVLFFLSKNILIE